MGRSEKYGTWYKVGASPQGDVYWHPWDGYALERDNRYLVRLEDLSDVTWFTDAGDLETIIEDVESNAPLLEIMEPGMREHVVAALEEDAEWAEECAAEKEATLRQSSGVYELDQAVGAAAAVHKYLCDHRREFGRNLREKAYQVWDVLEKRLTEKEGTDDAE